MEGIGAATCVIKIILPFLTGCHRTAGEDEGYNFYVRAPSSAIEMALGILPYRVENKCLTQKHFNFVVAPILGG
jgi:hypothetical protein